MYAQVFKFNENHEPAGSSKGGKFAPAANTTVGVSKPAISAGSYKRIFDNPIYTPIDKRLIDSKEKDRPLNDPVKTLDIENVLPNEKHKYVVPYSSTPFFDKLNKMQGTPDPMKIPVEQYTAARQALFDKQPVEKLPIKDLIFTQTVVNKDKIAKNMADKKDKEILVVRYKHEDYVMDGHHTTVARALRGKSHVEAHVLDIK